MAGFTNLKLTNNPPKPTVAPKPTTAPATKLTITSTPSYAGHITYFGSPEKYAEAIKAKEASGQALTDPAAAAAFKAANPQYFEKPTITASTGSSGGGTKPQIAPPGSGGVPAGWVPIRAFTQDIAPVGWDPQKGVSVGGQYLKPGEYVVKDRVSYADPNLLRSVYLFDYLHGPGSSSLGLDPEYDRWHFENTQQYSANQDLMYNRQIQYGIDPFTGQYTGATRAPELKQEIALPGSVAEIEQIGDRLVAPMIQEAASGSAAVQAGSLKIMNQTLDMITTLEQQLMSRMQEMLGGVDEATLWALRGVRQSIEEQRNRLMDEMNRRGLLQSGIWLEMEDRINKNQLDAESQIRLARVGELQNMLWNSLNNFANQRINAIQQYGRDYVNAIDQEYQNRMRAYEAATGQAIDWVGQQQQMAQRQNQFSTELAEKQRQFNLGYGLQQKELGLAEQEAAQRQKNWQAEFDLEKKYKLGSLAQRQSSAKQKTQTANTVANKVETYYKTKLPSYFETPKGYYLYITQPEQAQKIINDIGAKEYQKLVDWARKYL